MNKPALEMTKDELEHLSNTRKNLTLPLFPEGTDFEARELYILIGTQKGEMYAIRTVGDWKNILLKLIRQLCPWGVKTINPGIYKQDYYSKSKLLHSGYTILEDLNVQHVNFYRNLTVQEQRFKLVPEPKSNLEEPEYL